MRAEDFILRDPFILPWEGKYYLYGTRSLTCWSKEATGFDAYVSSDLENWEGPIEVFHKPDDFWAKNNFWAPEVHPYKGSFYMFATFNAPDCNQGTAILKADNPLGPFYSWSDKTVTPKGWECLDGTFYVSPNGEPYMVFCHEWKQIHDGAICGIKLAKDLKKAAGEPFVILKASQGKPLIKSFLFFNYVTDGPFLYRTEDGKLHLLWSSFGKGGYVQALAYSSNQDIEGKWEAGKELLFDKDGGHGMVFKTFDGQLMLALHAPNTRYKEHVVLKKLIYKNGVLRKEEQDEE